MANKANKAAVRATNGKANGKAKANGKGKGKVAKAQRKAATKYTPTAKITLLAKGNPKRKNTNEFKRFAQYRNGMQVQQAMALGMNALNLTRDFGLGFISIAGHSKPLPYAGYVAKKG